MVKRTKDIEEAEAPKRVALYTRVSTEDQAKEGFSLDAQLDSLRSFCKAKSWQIVKEYVDEGHSGRSIKRPAYLQMFAEKDLWDMILVVKMDRIHRNSRNFMEMMDNLRKWDKEFSSVQESLDTSTAMGRFVVDIIQRIAQLESEQIGERVYTGMKQKAKGGKGYLGFNIPYGYDYKNEKLEINKMESKIVSKIFNMYVKGMSIGKIVADLNNSNIPTKHGKKWAKKTVAAILKNPLYCGYVRWDKNSTETILNKGTHKPIISIDRFNRIQRLIASRIKNITHKPKLVLQIKTE